MQSPWLVFLDELGAHFADNPACEVRFQDERAEVALAAQATILSPLTHLGLLRVEGEDAAAFLHNLTSNDIKKLPLHSAHHDSLNSPKGRMLASLIVWRDASGYFVQLSRELLPAIQKKLSMYVLRSKVQIRDATPDYAIIGLSGPAMATALDSAGLQLPAEVMSVSQGPYPLVRVDASRVQVLVPVAQAADIWRKLAANGAANAGSAAWRWLDIRAGIPLITTATQDEFVAQMINFEILGGVSFQKGCYPGQEIVARTQYLGKLKKRMFAAHIDSDALPAAGADVFSAEFGEQSCGKLVAVAPAPQGGYDVLVVLQLASQAANDVHLASLQGPQLAFSTLPYSVS